ncbi:MAG: ATP-binding protein, partial [Acidobacteriota bacterium]|nr:ATP-binding protein [Acidobacteriota bacterium]
AAADAMPAPAAIDTLCATFGLSPFERDVLLLCAGVELDANFSTLFNAAAQGDARRGYPTFSLALAALPDAHWSALAPDGPLRRWRLVEVGGGGSSESVNGLTTSPLRIDERVLHYLAGIGQTDERLAALIEPTRASGDPVDSHRALAARIAAAWTDLSRRAAVDQTARLPVIQLCGEGDAAHKHEVAAAVSNALGLNLVVLSAHAIPSGAGDVHALVRLWEREAALTTSMLLVDCDDDDADPPDAAHERALTRFIERTGSPLVIATRERRHAPARTLLTFDVPRPTAGEQRALWRNALDSLLAHGEVETDAALDELVAQFSVDTSVIRAASVEAIGNLASTETTRGEDAVPLARALWDACRRQARPRLDSLAQRIEPAARWDDLVLPEAQRGILREIATHVRQRAVVYETWDFAGQGARGLGISALFAGHSGTGKTMAAEVLADELRLDLYRIDLSAVVSKYIGETEKNLRRVFDAAEAGGVILLFDEADALFGKRTEVKDSHDRYANIEVSYLLQRMEAYRGLAILTTNMKSALDPAFLRRIRFVVPFPFPDVAERAEIWRRVFPRATPTEELNFDKLARLNVAGGNIRNIALGAAFLAADAAEPVRMSHLRRAARGEYAKLERPLTDAEIGGWS